MRQCPIFFIRCVIFKCLGARDSLSVHLCLFGWCFCSRTKWGKSDFLKSAVKSSPPAQINVWYTSVIKYWWLMTCVHLTCWDAGVYNRYHFLQGCFSSSLFYFGEAYFSFCNSSPIIQYGLDRFWKILYLLSFSYLLPHLT